MCRDDMLSGVFRVLEMERHGGGRGTREVDTYG